MIFTHIVFYSTTYFYIASASKGITTAKLSLNELYQQTKLKLILTNDSAQDKQNFPYLNINQQQVETPYSITILQGKSRSQLIAYLTMLCSDARSITLYDPYFTENWQNTKKVFTEVLPRKTMTIENINPFKQNFINELKNLCPNWKFRQGHSSYRNNHDRYLKIDDYLEIIISSISSGFSYLWDTKKEITCVFKIIKN